MKMSVPNSKNVENDTQPIQVFLRIRPFLNNEQGNKYIKISSSREVLVKVNYPKKFTFDKVFGEKATQSDIYNAVVQPYVSQVTSGYSCTVITYGHASTGKTYTMDGAIPTWKSTKSLEASSDSTESGINSILVEECGLIPRVVTDLFCKLKELNREYLVNCTYVEVCKEDLYDLFSASSDANSIKIYNKRSMGSTFHGAMEVSVKNECEVFELLRNVRYHSQTTTTFSKEKSGYSHTIFTVNVQVPNNSSGDKLWKIGKLMLVDLGSTDNVGKSGGGERRLRDSANQSLLALGRVINALSEKNSHVPFRESKLTRILQDSLGGSTKTSIIATVAYNASHIEETLSTLEYAQRARTIINKPQIIQQICQKTLADQYMNEISRLRKDLAANRTEKGIYLNPENYSELKNYAERFSQQVHTVNLNVSNACRDVNDLGLVYKNNCAELERRNLLSHERDTELCGEATRILAAINDDVVNGRNQFEETIKSQKRYDDDFKEALYAQCEAFNLFLESTQNEHGGAEPREEAEHVVTQLKKLTDQIESSLPNTSVMNGLSQQHQTNTDRYLDVIKNARNLFERLSEIPEIDAQKAELHQRQLTFEKNMESTKESVDGGMKSLIEEYGNNIGGLAKMKEEIGTLLDEAPENPCEKLLAKFNLEASEMHRVEQNHLSEIFGAIEDGGDAFTAKCFDACKDKQRILHNVAEDLYSGLLNNSKNIDDLLKSRTDRSRRIHQYNSVLADNIRNLQSTIGNESATITEVQRAGDTPIPAQYKYPSQIKDITPKEVALSQFRKRQDAIRRRLPLNEESGKAVCTSSTYDNPET